MYNDEALGILLTARDISDLVLQKPQPNTEDVRDDILTKVTGYNMAPEQESEDVYIRTVS